MKKKPHPIATPEDRKAPKRKGPARGHRRGKDSPRFKVARAGKDKVPFGTLLAPKLVSKPGSRSKDGEPVCKRPSAGTPKNRLQDFHDEKMKRKANDGRGRGWSGHTTGVSASINRHTNAPHEGAREKAKRRGRGCKPHG